MLNILTSEFENKYTNLESLNEFTYEFEWKYVNT